MGRMQQPLTFPVKSVTIAQDYVKGAQDMKKTVLREYAKLIVRCGVNVQKGQEVMIFAGLDQPEFVQMVVEEAYRAKAKKVIVEWSYQPLEKLDTRCQTLKTLGTVEAWESGKSTPTPTAKKLMYLIQEDHSLIQKL